MALDIIPKKLKVHSLTGRINPELMCKAWKAVKRNRGAAGIDRVSIQKYAEHVETHLATLLKDLKTRDAFQTPPLRRVYIPKAGSDKLRPLGIPTVNARIAQEVVRLLINPIFEKQFHDDSYGFRHGRNCHQAVEKVQAYFHSGLRVVVDVDIKGFFDNIPHKVIMSMLTAEIADGNILDIIEKFLTSGVMEDGKRLATIKGTPQGGVISPLLANIVLNYLDWKLDKKGHKFVRYADDIVILTKTTQEAKEALEFTIEVLRDLGLEISPEKTKISTHGNGFQFLGFEIKGQNVVMRSKSREKFENALKEITRRCNNFSEEVVVKLNRVLRGTVNYFTAGFTKTVSYFTEVDKWLRMRLRCMKYKRKWHTDNRRLKNKHLNNRGLLSCRELCLARKAKLRCSST
jgi:group II intron reverse transcriptase/maturase